MRVLIVKVSSLGDIIHTLPAVTDAVRAKPELRFDWVAEENFVEVPSWHPAIERVIPVAIRRWRKNLRQTLRDKEVARFREELQHVHYDLVIDAQGLIKSGIISRMAKGLTVGLSNSTIKEPLATLFYNKRISVPKSDHAVQRVRELFSRSLNYRVDHSQIDYGLDRARIGLSNTQPVSGDEQPSVVFLHGTTWPTKHWPLPYWKELARLASAAGYVVKLPWGDETELARARDIAEGVRGATVLPRLNLSELACVLSQAYGAVAVDTGLGHLAAALDVPAVSLYGPTNPALSGTYGRNQLQLKSDIACAPCVRKQCEYAGDKIIDTIASERFQVEPPCFSTHPPAEVLAKLQQLVGRHRGRNMVP